MKVEAAEQNIHDGNQDVENEAGRRAEQGEEHRKGVGADTAEDSLVSFPDEFRLDIAAYEAMAACGIMPLEKER